MRWVTTTETRQFRDRLLLWAKEWLILELVASALGEIETAWFRRIQVPRSAPIDDAHEGAIFLIFFTPVHVFIRTFTQNTLCGSVTKRRLLRTHIFSLTIHEGGLLSIFGFLFPRTFFLSFTFCGLPQRLRVFLSFRTLYKSTYMTHKTNHKSNYLLWLKLDTRTTRDCITIWRDALSVTEVA